MKKFLVVAFCMVLGTSVSAQEEAVVGDVQDNAAATIVEAPVTESSIVSAPQESETPAPIVVGEDSEAIIAPEVVGDAAVVEGTTEMMPLTEASVVSGGYVEAAPCTGCAQIAPVMNYDTGMGYVVGGATYAQAVPCSGCVQAAAPVYACCDDGGSRRQRTVSIRSRVSTRTSLRDRRASRRNPCCN